MAYPLKTGNAKLCGDTLHQSQADIPFLLEVAAVLATFVHPNHIVYLCSWGFTHLPPTCNSKLFGYNVFLVRNIVSRKSRFEKRSRVLAAHRQIKGDILSAGLPAVKIDKLDSKTVFVPRNHRVHTVFERNRKA